VHHVHDDAGGNVVSCCYVASQLCGLRPTSSGTAVELPLRCAPLQVRLPDLQSTVGSKYQAVQFPALLYQLLSRLQSIVYTNNRCTHKKRYVGLYHIWDLQIKRNTMSAVSQHVFVSESTTHAAATSAVVAYMHRVNVAYAVQKRECTEMTDEEIGANVALTERNYGAYVFTSTGHDGTVITGSKKRGRECRYYAVVYAPGPVPPDPPA